ncbi:molybdopterin molybdotransferase MoeA [Antarcticirhabdus aurantiaca]|uniref:Molybdopterin molybdotransferase MoeA n=1 Tax=Antarcticirhabdus aurantiaca TaxID=2606717 RepID=A0ACD4NVQ3_9HYPH|nr:gephyrin-like molybdotransferase Glp [Antarcticirhabdus aurantiaca]WAJ30887.1 molybdopterin molybdotransferase MoeA [Jeongeuplla avenae]
MSSPGLIPVDEALRRLLADVEPIPETDEVSLAEAGGRVLAEPVVAGRTQPDFDASAMDGYAVRAADTLTGGALDLIGASAAGRAFAGAIEPGQCVRIFTGAPVPTGADAVLIQENTRFEDGRCLPLEPVEPGRNIRRAGNDFARGDALIAAGSVMTPGRVALAASAGRPTLLVRRRPRVAVLATGDELVLPGDVVGPSQIVASNSFGVAAFARTKGATVLDYGIAPDDEAVIGASLDRAAAEGIDVFVTIGGASVGDHDLIGPVLASRGVALDFWKVRMRPGKPLMAGRLGPMRILGLPGNPASALVTAVLFLEPLLLCLAGRPAASREEVGILGADVPANDGRQDFVRATLSLRDDGRIEVVPLPRQDSSLLSTYASADGLLVRPVEALPARRGDPCRFIRLD